MYTWEIAKEVFPAPNAGSVAASAESGSAENAVNPVVTLTATANQDCGWRFSNWYIRAERQGSNPVTWSTSGPNPMTTFSRNIGGYNDHVKIVIRAVFSFDGSGKLMRSSAMPSKLIRVGDKLLLDV